MKVKSAWDIHLAKVYAELKSKNPNCKYSEAMKVAKGSYKK